MGDTGSRISEEQARRLWERAAELQAEADRKKEEEASEKAVESETSETVQEEDDGQGYSLTHVRQAAQEVGIRPEFLELALGEETILDLEGGGEEKALDRAASRFLANTDEALVIRRSYAFPPEVVWPVVEWVFTDDQTGVELLELRGGGPLEGGVAVFESPYTYQRAGTLEYAATVAEVRRFLVRVKPNSDGGGCEVEVHAPLRRSRRVNFWVGSGLSGGAGILGGLAGAGLAGAVSGGLAALPLAFALGTLTVGGAVGIAFAVFWVLRALYRYGSRLFERAVKRVLTRVERELLRGPMAALGPRPAGRPSPESGSGENG